MLHSVFQGSSPICCFFGCGLPPPRQAGSMKGPISLSLAKTRSLAVNVSLICFTFLVFLVSNLGPERVQIRSFRDGWPSVSKSSRFRTTLKQTHYFCWAPTSSQGAVQNGCATAFLRGTGGVPDSRDSRSTSIRMSTVEPHACCPTDLDRRCPGCRSLTRLAYAAYSLLKSYGEGRPAGRPHSCNYFIVPLI